MWWSGERGAVSLLGTLLLVAVVIVAGLTTVVLGMTLVPKEEPSTSYMTAFDIERVDGNLSIQPEYVPDDVEYRLRINDRQAYTWTEVTPQTLSCLTPGDELKVIADDTRTEQSHLIKEHDIELPTNCNLDGTAAQFAYAKVGNRKMPLESTQYEFTLAIDPDGPTREPPGEVDRDFPSTNGWVYIQKYDRQIDGLGPPAYVAVFPDNVHRTSYDWDQQPPESELEEMTNSYEIDSNDDVKVTAGGVEPTDDVYLVFEPGCDQSKLKFISMEGGFNNQILLDGSELFRTDSASKNTVYTVPGVECT